MSTAYPAYNRTDVDEKAQKAAIAEIDKILFEADKAYKATLALAEKLADEHDIELCIGTPTGMMTRSPNLPDNWDSSSCSDGDYYRNERGEWQHSSMSC